MAVKDTVAKLVEGKLLEMGYELVEVTYKKEYGNMTLTLFIDCDKEGGVGLDDCELVSRTVDPILDEADPTGGAPYHLNVSSPGLDRPIKTQRDFDKKKGTKVEALFYAPKDGTKRVEGILVGWSEQQVELEVKGKTKQYDKKDIAVLRPVIEF
ncbi:MAG: ribosome maturation factor RimP [Clostridia bacterium]|nr:ribosome maturation factor RimP [Clostridia bacterium]